MMSRINTALTRLLGTKLPVVAAPMAGASTVHLALEVGRGGGFGFIAAGYEPVEQLRAELSSVSSTLPSKLLPLGVGYLGWKLDESPNTGIALLNTALESNVQAVWFAFGKDLGRWVRHVRDFDSQRGSGRKTVVFVLVSSREEAVVAAHDWQADVLVAQGIESGGHGHASAPSLLTLVPSVISALAPNGPPVLAAGGLAHGSQVAAFLTLGAAGAALGTRFLLTPESKYTAAQKAALISAGAGSTTRTLSFDRARGTLGWPEGVDGRALRNRTSEDANAGVNMLDVRAKFLEAVQNDDPARMLVWAGEGVSLMTEIKGAKDICEEIHTEVVQRLQSVRSLLRDT
ncbi:2-nitropropane dioxygenase [Amylocystis lapponica]|nr:2-nitropropane dioxygenase [Amylocystis lapponica]